ncbi:hypothetical protein BG28_01265 [Nesterenkonia sp. AN1]|nr:hypothetical protein BG28_01265 [Nesterenkonia sp. AN1]
MLACFARLLGYAVLRHVDLFPGLGFHIEFLGQSPDSLTELAPSAHKVGLDLIFGSSLPRL